MPKLCFIMLGWGEHELIAERWKNVRRLYPDAWFIVRFDGDFSEKLELQRLFADPLAKVLEEPRLFGVDNGGLIAQRLLEIFLEVDADVFIKIDPDTQLRRRFRWLPEAHESYFGGCVQDGENAVSIQGGCIILTRSTAESLAKSKLLESDLLRPPALIWVANPPSRFRAFVQGMTSIDWCLGWALQQLRVPASKHPEVLSVHKVHAVTDFLRYYRSAVVHPFLTFLSVLSPINYWRKLQVMLQFQELRNTGDSAWCLVVDSFDDNSIPPGAVASILNKVGENGKILQLGWGSSSRELARFFDMVLIDDTENLKLNANVRQIKVTDRCSLAEQVCSVWQAERFDVLVVAGSFSKGKYGNLNELLSVWECFDGPPVLLVNDLQRPENLRTVLSLWLRRGCVLEFFFREHTACCAITTGRKTGLLSKAVLGASLLRTFWLSCRGGGRTV